MNYPPKPNNKCYCCGKPLEEIRQDFERLNKSFWLGTCKNKKCALWGQTISANNYTPEYLEAKYLSKKR